MLATLRWAIAVAVLTCGVTGAARGADDAEVEKLRQENAALKQRIAELEAELGKSKATATEAAARAQAAERQAADAKAKADAAAAERDAAVAQTAKAEAERRGFFVERRYDEASGQTTVSSRATRLEITRGTKLRHWLGFGARFAGKSGAGKVDAVTMTMHTAFTGTLYRGADELKLTIDGAEQTLKVAEYDSVMRTLGQPGRTVRKDDETVTLSMPLATLKAIGGAKRVTGVIAGNEFEMSGEQRDAAAAMVKEIEAE